ncbi:kelch-like protein 24 [Arctopsyche grandis]|uniref:kelch-like protein 24 n=1 Tax=Arctopsyche grandis TaxID=121162 RepID=UPI00406D92BB
MNLKISILILFISIKICESKFDDPDWLYVLLHPKDYDEKQIETAFQFARHNFMEIQLEDEFLQLNLEFFTRLIEPDDLNAHSEEIVFESVKRWLAFKHLKPQYFLHLLLEFVRLPLLSAEYLMSDVDPYIFASSKSHPYFVEALRYHLFPDQRPTMTSPQTKPRKSFQKFLAISSKPTKSPVVEIYNAALDCWSELINFESKEIYYYGAAFVKDSLMVIGGYFNETKNEVLSYDLKSGKSTTMAPLQDARYNMGIAVVEEEQSTAIYAIGGWGEDTALRTVEKWDTKNLKWVYVMPMLMKREAVGVATIGNDIYVAGGHSFDEGFYYNSMEVYNTKIDRWVPKSPMNRVRNHCSLTVAGEYIYAIGGYAKRFGYSDAQLEVERYDPRRDTWKLIESIEFGGWLGSGTMMGRPFYVGGEKDNTMMQEYDPEKGVWNDLAPLTIGRNGVIMVELPWNYEI